MISLSHIVCVHHAYGKKKSRRHWDRHQFWFVITEVFSLSHGNLLLTTKSSLLSLRNAATRLRSSKTRRERPAVRWLDRLKTNPQASQRNLEWETKANGSVVTQNVWICIDRHLAQTLFSYTPRAKHRISLLSLTSVLFDSSQVAKIYHHKVCMQNLLSWFWHSLLIKASLRLRCRIYWYFFHTACLKWYDNITQ